MKDALRFIEQHALFTRTGPQGIRQVNVQGLVATAFTHRDSRASDPDLHTHVAVANKVQTLDGRWLSIDGRVLFKANVAASETYNTSLKQHLRETLGVRSPNGPAPTQASGRSERSSGSTRDSTSAGPPGVPTSRRVAASWPSSSSVITADRRHRSKPCTSRSRQP